MKNASDRTLMRLSMLTTLVIGVAAVVIASRFATVLDAILYAYAFMVSGLFVPTLGAYFWKRSSSRGAFWGMLSGGTFTLSMMIAGVDTPMGLDPSFYGILLSGAVFVVVSLARPDAGLKPEIRKESEKCLIESRD
jgi:SSS family solute:Na+ symporter